MEQIEAVDRAAMTRLAYRMANDDGALAVEIVARWMMHWRNCRHRARWN